MKSHVFDLDVFQNLRNDFSSLWRSRQIGNTLVVESPYSTISGDVISVYITQRGGRYIVTDGARLDALSKEQGINLLERKGCHLRDMLSRFSIDEHRDNNGMGTIYRFKSTEDINLLSSIVYDVIHFVDSMANAIMLDSYFNPEIDAIEAQFRTRVNAVLRQKIELAPKKLRRFDVFKNKSARSLQFSSSLIDKVDDCLWLGMCINGSNYPNYMRSVQRAEFGFNHAQDTELRLHGSMRFAAITDVLNFGQSERLGEIQSVISKWPDKYHVQQFSLGELEAMRIESLWGLVG